MRRFAAATIKQAIYLIHDIAKCLQFGPTTGNASQRSPLSWSQGMPDKQVTVLKQVTGLLFDLFPAACC